MIRLAPKLKVGDITRTYGKKVRVVMSTTVTSDCIECEIHSECNRDYFHLRDLCKQYNVTNCGDLIGNGKHFEIVETQ